MKVFKIISIFLILTSLFSCESFLEEKDPNQITNATFWKNSDELEQGLTATYSALKQAFLWNSQGFKNMNSRGDDIVARIQNAQIYKPDLFLNDPSNTFARDMWKNAYILIYRANQVIDNSVAIEMDEKRKQEVVLEAKFLRGLAYFVLAQNFKEAPLVLSSVPETRFPAKATEDELWGQIISDFKEASLLPASYAPNLAGHATKWSALSYLAKSYLYREQWQLAATELKGIIDSGQFALMPDVYDNWNSEKENNQESIFEIQYMYSTASNQVNDGDIHFAPAVVGGFYVLTPSEWIFREFQKEKTVDGDFDLRMYATFIWNYPGAEIYQEPFTKIFANAPNTVTWKKFQLWDKSLAEASLHRSEINERVMRYSHVLLMYAETQAELGNLPLSIKAINEIRNRANLSSLVEGSMNQNEILKEIMHQRALEFHLEGERWYDIVRWGIGKEVFTNNLKRPDYMEKFNYFPIPQEELDANKNLTQNVEWKQ
ncbi:RagB/SusD family nutrient uptake outer membrane protein [Flavobacterium sp. TAB 87]|uniref:RagB/SusD family nutrient uptake outer membrane protein n=1 Tax=Flavobacterium sp. TAB 87 TaxID=1729581 RepID=UPI00076D6CF8|nr:RagB/SusD family nutrient uptake outer membrane protein [Flavobacterium sp. TAB 87]KVV15624.1 SusD family protein [Flavobacterium sp. TAB 87]